MAIKKQYRSWNKIPVEIRTNTDTGEVQVWTDSRVTLIPGQLASSQAGKPWVVDNKDLLTRNFNGANGTSSTPQEVSKAFLTEGYKVFNNDRAAVLNNKDNYSSPQDAITKQKNFYNTKIPLVKNPTTQQQVSSQGQQTSQQTTATQPQPQPQTTGNTTVTTGSSVDVRGSSDAAGSADTPSPIPIPTQPYQQSAKTIPPTVNPNNTPPPDSPLLLRYPLSNLDEIGDQFGIGYDFIKINVVNHVSSLDPTVFLSGEQVRIENIIGDVKRGYGKPYATIILPMLQNISTSNSTDWASDSANVAQLVGSQLFASYFTGQASGQNPMEGMKKLFSDLIQTTGAFADIGVSNKQSLAAIAAGYLVGNSNVLTRATGTVVNPNMEMLFNGPRMRSFNFQFDMTPRSREESDQIRKIIKTFKKHMSPSKTYGNAFLKTPKIFLLEYIYNGNISGGTANGNTHPYLNKFKPCALTEFNVNYTPDGSYMTYREDGSMTRYSIQMQFSEISPIYEGDYDDKNDMGY